MLVTSYLTGQDQVLISRPKLVAKGQCYRAPPRIPIKTLLEWNAEEVGVGVSPGRLASSCHSPFVHPELAVGSELMAVAVFPSSIFLLSWLPCDAST